MPSRRRALERNVRRFDRELSRKSFDVYQRVIELFVEAYPSEVRERINGTLRARDFVSLLSWDDSFGGVEQSTAEDSFSANQLSALIKKYPFPSPELKPKATAKAIEKFLLAEERCRRYNLKFRGFSARRIMLEPTLNRMAQWIARVIGESPPLQLIYSKCSFGPGASIGVHGNSTNLARKLTSEKWTCTPSALPFAAASMIQDQHIMEFLVKDPKSAGPFCMDPDEFRKKLYSRVQPLYYNKIVTVPKTTLVDRTIAVEPLLNGYLQKGIDVVMRLFLKRVGIDLTDQGRNQNLARLGSTEANDPFVTIDLSLASDSISCALVRRLLPPDWYHFLDAVRSPAYKLQNGVERRYEKFVSMGNGFCFPLETLIFASICSLYSHPDSFSVYGDDIVVRQSVARRVIKTLWAVGFRHNLDKTFLEGPFRESCGADWFAGRDIRPLTLDYEFDSLGSLIKFHNMTLSKPLWVLPFSEIREYLRELVPEEIRFTRPYKGNVYGAFEVELDMFQASPYSRWDRDIQAWGWTELEIKGVPDRELLDHDRYSTALVMAAVRGSRSVMPFARRRKTSQSVRRTAYAGATSSWTPPQI
jgi:hypothetical protein